MLVWSFHKKLLDTNSWRRMHSMENSNPTSLQLIKSSKHQKQGYGRQIRLFEELLKSRLCHPQPHRLYRTPTTCSLRVWLMLSCSVILWNRIKIQSGWKELFALCMRGNNNNCAIHKNLLACIYTCMPPLINPKQEVNIEEALSCLFQEGEKSAWQVYWSILQKSGILFNIHSKFLLKAAIHHKQQFWMTMLCIRHQTLLFANSKRVPSAVIFYNYVNKNI